MKTSILSTAAAAAFAVAVVATVAGLCAPVAQGDPPTPPPACTDQACVQSCVQAAYAAENVPAAQACMDAWKNRQLAPPQQVAGGDPNSQHFPPDPFANQPAPAVPIVPGGPFPGGPLSPPGPPGPVDRPGPGGVPIG